MKRSTQRIVQLFTKETAFRCHDGCAPALLLRIDNLYYGGKLSCTNKI